MGDDQTMHDVLEKLGNLNGMLTAVLDGQKSISNEQHEIKKSIENLQKDVKSTVEQTTRNDEQIKHNKETFDKFTVEVKEKFVRAYDAMEKKDSIVESKVSMANKIWAMTAVISFLVAAGFAYYSKIPTPVK